ncbi:MAG: HAD family hydrolase [Hellea sp.]
MTIIAMWSGPRNLSTAMMRSFGARADCSVIDEPYFAPFLKVSGKAHPGRDETLARHEYDPQEVAELCSAPTETAYCFQKHMPHHMLEGFPMDWAYSKHETAAKHFFLIREPARVIASYIKGRDAFDLDDLGFAPQRRLWEQLGRPPVIDSLDILRWPKTMLSQLCHAIDIPFDTAMLSWEKGARDEDGAWAPYWYKSVESSTGFAPPPETQPVVPPQYRDMLAACEEDYAAMEARKLTLKLA